MEREYADTGFGPIDEEHRALTLGLKALVEALRSGEARAVAAELAKIRPAVAAHFAHEEQLMAEHAYPKAARHEEAHGLFLADAAKKAAALGREGLTDDVRRWIMGRLVEWFRFHIMTHDIELGRFLLARLGAGATPPAAATEVEVPGVEIELEIEADQTGRADVRG